MERINEYLEIIEEKGEKFIRCRCSYVISPAIENYKNHVLWNDFPLSKAGPYINPYKIGQDRFVFREFYCPKCLTLLDTEVALKGEQPLWDVQPIP